MLPLLVLDIDTVMRDAPSDVADDEYFLMTRCLSQATGHYHLYELSEVIQCFYPEEDFLTKFFCFEVFCSSFSWVYYLVTSF